MKVECQGRDQNRDSGDDQGGQKQTPLEAQVVVGSTCHSLWGWISCHHWQILALTVQHLG
jgi:hypothetical protein